VTRSISLFPELSKYKILEKIGAGGMGEVFKAMDTLLMRTVAIKVIAKKTSSQSDADLRFLHEARAVSHLNHPNIITIHEIVRSVEHDYIVMEYVKGNSLRELMDSGAMRADKSLEIAMQICDGLSEAHSRGIIHRDIKPENILINERGLVKLLDFGLAKRIGAFDADQDGLTHIKSLTQSGAIVGTISYMSPEQLRADKLDERTDIFSFGIILYGMITGKHPFSGKSPLDVAASILKDDVVKPTTLLPGMPGEVALVALRCLQRDVDKRFDSFAEIKAELTRINRRLFFKAGTDEPTVELPSLTEELKTPSPVEPKTALRPLEVLTILVLPLEDVSSSEEGSHIGVGLAHAIRTSLAKISGLSVLSKSASAGRIDQAGGEARKVARELGATILLEGEVVRSGQVIEVMARLTDCQSNRIIWGDQYRGDISNLFSIQDGVCADVAAALKVNIPIESRNRMAQPATTNIAAFEYYSKGRALIERYDIKENVEQAILMFEEAARLDRSFALAHAGLCEAYWQKYAGFARENMWVERAIAAGDLALVLDPHQAQVHISLGIIYKATGNLERAIQEFERAVALQPMSSDAHRWLGRCYQRKGDLDRAVKYFEKAIQIRPGFWESYLMLGICYYIFGRYKDAAEQFRQLIIIQPDSYQGYDKLGGIYILLGRYEDAVTMQKRAIDIYPNETSYTNLGTAYFYLQRYEEAIAAYKSAIELNPRNDILCRNLGDAYLYTGRTREAEEQFEIACRLLKERLSIEGGQGEALGRLAICLAKLHQMPEAMATIEQAMELEPNNTMLMYQRSVVCSLAGETDKAIEFLSQSLSKGYSRAEAQLDPDLAPLRGNISYESLFATKH